MLYQKKDSGEEINELITTDDILGKDVIDSEGRTLGIVDKIMVDPKEIEIVSISIDKGFLKKGMVIGKSYISRITPYAIFLNISPSYNIRGKQVFDLDGKRIGTVVDVILKGNTNALDKIIVKANPFSKRQKIDSSLIGEIADNVILRIRKKDIVYS